MSANTETASEYYRLASLAADRGNEREALRYGDKAQERLLREPNNSLTERSQEMRYPAQRYAPQSTHMKNVVKTANCRPLFQRRPRYWLRRLFAGFATVILFISFFVALFIIGGALK